MPYLEKCDGCGKELNTLVDNIHYQGKDKREKFCQVCNKRFPIFEDARKPIYDKYDELKRKDVREMRNTIFVDGIDPRDGSKIGGAVVEPPKAVAKAVNTARKNLEA